MRAIAAELGTLAQGGLYRRLPKPCAAINFSSNDYLGLAQNDEIRSRLIEMLRSGCALGSTGSRLLTGNSEFHSEAERFLAEVHGSESALLLSSGYAANLSVLTVLASAESEFFCDELNHASLIDGVRFARSKKQIFRHNDVAHLQTLLEASPAARKIIVTESVFSMDGDLAPLGEIHALALAHSAFLVIDEAHASGVFGDRGLGLIPREWRPDPRLVSVHTGGKAYGAEGAFVLCARPFLELLVNRARPFVFSTALSPLAAYHLRIAVEYVLAHPGLGTRLLHDARDFTAKLGPLVGPGVGRSQILPLILGSSARATAVAEVLLGNGFNVRPIRSPTVAPGTERLRITLSLAHDQSTRDRLARILCEELAL